jgi:tRNA(Arg) A34 adenosine deaminase TadA
VNENTSTPRRAFLTLAGYSALIVPEFTPQKGFAATAGSSEIGQIPGGNHQQFIERAFEMKHEAIRTGDQGYGALVVRDSIIVGQAPSRVIVNTDPTSHAEMEAIRDAASRLGNRDLGGCTLYSSSHPCPMCEAAAYWAGIDKMIYGDSATDAGRPTLCW